MSENEESKENITSHRNKEKENEGNPENQVINI